MKTRVEQWALATLVRKERVIDPTPQYQRGPVWSLSQKQLLIDSILRGIDIPKIYLRELPQEGKKTPKYQYEVIDGQQRLRSLWEFFNREFELADDADPVGKFELKRLDYNDLPEKLKDELDTHQLSIVIVDATEEDIEEMFLRLQNGTTLKAAERRNAISGKVRDFIRAVSKNKFLKNSVPFRDQRFAFDAITSQMLALELAGGPTDIKDKDLEAMYEMKDFDSNGIAAKNLKRTLQYLAKEFNERTPELKKQVVVTLYLMVSDLLRNYTFSKVIKRGEFKEWFLEFEAYKNLQLSRSEDEFRDADIDSYNLNLQQGTNRKDSLAKRMEVLMKHFLLKFPQIEYKDSQRNFSSMQRLAIFRRDKGLCKICGKKVDWDDFAVDHIIPHSRGGKTTIDNGQLSCHSCNLKKGSK